MATIAQNLESTIKLRDGNAMPLFGLGVWKAQSGENGRAENAVYYALKNGYKMIDTANIYGNQADVREGLKKSGVKRDDVFLVTKLWKKGYESCRDEFYDSLKQLDCGYLDLYLIHSPSDGHVLESYKAMVEFQQQGLVKSIGVSNFDVDHLEHMKAAGVPMPAVNQVELHPFQKKRELVSYCQQNNIAVMGYSPLMNGTGITDPMFVSLAERLKKTVAQTLIRYSVQMGYITIPKTVTEARIIENAQVFDWSIPDEDMAALNTLPEKSFAWNAIASPWKG
ncbi:glyoxal reductase-like [Babylonia areolata]|uniref:glyoxal reductase-like n=1 Tax=Babylonia areolata TaxID=304850 RepID=UPI003FD4D0EE